jgi:hypothetical protein
VLLPDRRFRRDQRHLERVFARLRRLSPDDLLRRPGGGSLADRDAVDGALRLWRLAGGKDPGCDDEQAR